MSFLTKKNTGVWVVDVQDKLFVKIDRSSEILDKICFILEAASFLKLPIIVTEQYPQGLGRTVKPIQERLTKEQIFYSKTSFSGFSDSKVRLAVNQQPVDSWILVGIEAHICVLQTAKDLLEARKHVVVLNDAISSRSIYDFSTAIGEIRDIGGRISSAETVVYELIRDASSVEFKKLHQIHA